MENIYRLFRVLGKWKEQYLFAGMLLGVSSFVQMMEPKVLQIAIDQIVKHIGVGGRQLQEPDWLVQFFYTILPSFDTENLTKGMFGIGILFICLALVRSLSYFVAGVIAASSTEKAIKSLRDFFFQHIQALPLRQIDKFPTGEMIQRCTGDITTVRNFIGTQITEVIRLIALFFGALIMMLSVHVSYALISIALVPFITITALFFFMKEKKVWDEHEKEQDKLTAIIQENLNGIRVVQAFAKEDYEIEKFHQQNLAKRAVGLKHVAIHQWFWTYSDFLINLQIAISLVAGAYFSFAQQISLGEFASFFTYAVVVTWPMRKIGQVVSQMGMATVAMERMTEIIDAKEEDYEGYKPPNGIKGDIEFRNVVFKYTKEDEHNALDGVSFNIKAGEKVAFMGGTGAGKSTIIALLARFYEPDSGEIFLDGKPLREYSKSSLRSRLGIVHQKAFLFSTSVKENINFANKAVSEEEILEVASIATVADFIPKLPNGYETLVGEKGVSLSGGQKQRVALARTLLIKPDVLLLDDATSAVDTETEYKIQNALQKRMEGKTAIIIAHRLTSIQNADKIIVFKQGKILEQGTHNELLEHNKFYKKVYNLQVALETEIEDNL